MQSRLDSVVKFWRLAREKNACNFNPFSPLLLTPLRQLPLR